MKSIFDIFRKKDDPKSDFNTKDNVLEHILGGELASIIEFKAKREDNMLYLPELQMYIKPEIQQLMKKAVVLGFYMYSDKWDKQMYETSTGMGSDTRSAVGQALASFAFAFMAGLKRMTDKYEPRKISSVFAGNDHDWDVYLSDIVAVGSKSGGDEKNKVGLYWELLKDDIIKRLGNNKLVYVKIYAAKLPDSAIGECRIDDINIPELGEKVKKIAEKWTSDGLVSEKQFFFIEQSPQTVSDYPYIGAEGREKMKSLVLEYLKLFDAVDSQEDYDNLFYNAAEKLGDRTLAMECFSFLTEICAERVFSDKLIINDYIEINLPDGTALSAYKTQFKDYKILDDIMSDIMSENTLGDRTREIYAKLAGASSICGVVQQLDEKKLSGAKLSKLIFNMDEGFELR